VSGIPRANGFNGFFRALSGEPGLFVTVAEAMLKVHHRQLDASVEASNAPLSEVRARCGPLLSRTSEGKGH
jgi:hypothetical protein